ncbi:reverse transcriptase domain-containing protein [Tanacetum coccineum]|uniref:Reverse transcriptase domain-containing protein n=1 Tax=Tanacetum coccineum TaxID=301880 RepID=A0ABQ5BS95_9ASTR
MLKAGNLSHLIKELKQNSGKEQPKTAKKRETSVKDKALAILMVQPWERVARQKITQSFSPNTKIFFPPLDEDEGIEGPMIIEVEIGGHCIYHMEKETSHAPKPIMEKRVKVAINPEYPEQTVMIDSTLTEEGRNKLCNLLQRNLDIFAWKPADMTGVPSHIAEHRLNVREGCSPVRQKKRGQAADRNQAIQEEVRKLVETGIMKEVHYHDWLSNPVMVKKHDDSWRMCVDFKDLNKACQKDGYPLPEIDWKNAGATYQRLVDKAFHKQNGRNLEVHVDDLVIKTCTKDEIVRDIEETFKTLRKINMKLNPKKCTFGVEKGMFLGYKVNTKGLKVSLDKVDAKSDFHWTAETEEAFKQMKQLIAELPMLTAPMEKEELIVYLEAAKETVKEELPKLWILFTDGSSCTDGSGAGLILTNPEGMEFTYALRFRFDATNNEAEYEALIAGLLVEEEGDTWMTPIFEYLKEETLPADVKKARTANYVLREIHEGSCSKHAGTRSVVAKALRIGYYLPTMHKDARALIRACQDCQVHKPVPRNPQQMLTPITFPWPFYKWGIDIAGPFLEGPGKVEFLIVVVDYFTKWIEAKPVATITGNQIRKFVWDKIVCRFGLLGEIISDNGKQFRDNPFKDWCEKLCIRQHFASVKHLQTNGLVERANRSFGEGIKARLDARSKIWMEEPPHVLWAHRTMIKSSNRDTPFSLTYRTEAVIQAETGMPTLRTVEVELVQNNEALGINHNHLEERREEAAIRAAKIKARMEKYYNSKVKNTNFKPGYLVYRNNDASRTKDTRKLGPKWEGPYEVMEALRKGAYKLRDRDGKQLPRTWNVSQPQEVLYSQNVSNSPMRIPRWGNAFQSILFIHCNVF